MATNGNPLTEHLDLWSSALLNKSTAGRGRNGKLEAYGIKKLRELILELAVRGKLVPQDPNDEPASVLLEKIEKERRKLISDGRMKKLPVLPELDAGKKSITLPCGWTWGFVTQVVVNEKYAIKRGPFGSAIRKDFFVPNGYKIYEQQNAIRDDFSLGDYYINGDKFNELKAFEVKPNDVIISCSGTVGKVAVAPYWMEPGVINQALLKLSLNESALTNDYFKLLFPTYYMKTETLSELQGTAQKNMVSVETLKGEAFPLPPLAEQRRIVAKVDELMALCDRLEQQQADSQEAHQTLVATLLGALTQTPVRAEPVEARPSTSSQETAFLSMYIMGLAAMKNRSNSSKQRQFHGNALPRARGLYRSGRTEFEEVWTRIADHFDTLFTTENSIDQLKQTILQLAVMGKLVPQDPNDEPASAILKNIRAEKVRLIAAGKLNKEKLTSPMTQEEQWCELPNGWVWARFTDYAVDIATGPFGSMIHQSDYVPNGIPLINPSHMINDEIVPEMSVAVSKDMAKKLESYSLHDGDIVMARRGEVGRIAMVTENEVGWLCGTGSFILRFTKEPVRDYLKLVFRCEFIRNYLAGEAVGTTMVNLNHAILKKMPIAVPPLAEQHRIVAKVDELMALCDTLKARLKAAQATQINLADAIVELAAA